MSYNPPHLHYDRAPIREAIIDVQIDQPATLSVAALDVQSIRARGYPESRKLFRGQMIGHMEAGKLTAKTEADQCGYQFIGGGDGKHVVQFRLDGFTFSRLAPYVTWEQLRDEAKHVWASYRQVVPEARVRRVALRYVNQLDLPAQLRDFKDYIRTYPEISSDLPQELAGFFSQIQIPFPQIEAMLILTQAMVPPASPNLVSVVLDIDIFKDNLKSVSDADIWGALELLRVQKNLVFESCITNRTRELIS